MSGIKLYEHPSYSSNLPLWKVYRDCFEGNQATMRKTIYLPQFEAEKGDQGRQAYNQRLLRTWYTNLTKRIVFAWKGFLFKFDPKFEGSNFEQIISKEEQADIDGEGTSLEDFIKNKIGTTYLVYGNPFVHVDAPRTAGPLSESEAEANGLRPFGEVWTPLEVPDWQKITEGKNLGKYQFIQRQFKHWPMRLNPTDKPEAELMRKVMKLTQNGYEIQFYKAEQGVQSAAQGEKQAVSTYDWNPVGSPVVLANHDRIPVATIKSDSWIKDVVWEQLRFHNGKSSYEHILHHQAYRLTFIAGKPIGDTPNINAGEANVIWLDEGSQVTALTSENPVALRTWLQDVSNDLIQVGMNQLDRLDGTSKQVESDRTIREKKDEIIALGRATITELENLCNEFLGYWAKFKGKELGDAKITLPKDLRKEDADNLLAVFNAIRDDLNDLPKQRKAWLKKMANQGEFTSEEMADIEKEIDAANFGQQDTTSRDQFLKGFIGQNGA